MTLLDGARIGLLEARLSSELAELVRREGGEPVCAPAVSEAPLDVAPLLPVLVDDLRQRRVRIVVFLTGAGAASLLDQASDAGMYDPLVDALRDATTCVADRSPRRCCESTASRCTSTRARRTPRPSCSRCSRTLVVAGRAWRYCTTAAEIRRWSRRCARAGRWCRELRSYEWRLPDDVEPIETLIAELIDGRLDAIAFTNQVQVRHLFQVGARIGRTAALRYALRHRTIVGSIGPTCSLALDEHGVPPHTVASPPKMRPLVAAVGEQLAARRGHTTADFTS